jgi:hypothetical protein
MSNYCYIIDDDKGTRLYLTEEGPEQESGDRADEFLHDGFRHIEDRRIGSCVLHVFERATPATDITGTTTFMGQQ